MARQTIPSNGPWGAIAGIFNSMFTELFQKQRFGVYNYDDLGTKTTPITIAAPATWYPLTNDGAGPSTLKFPLDGIPDVWNTTTQAFDFSPFELGDTFDIRLDIVVTSGTANQDFDISLFVADGEPGSFEIPFIVQQLFKASGNHRIIRYNGTFAGSTFTKDNPLRFKIRSSAAGSVVVNGWYVRANVRTAEVV